MRATRGREVLALDVIDTIDKFPDMLPAEVSRFSVSVGAVVVEEGVLESACAPIPVRFEGDVAWGSGVRGRVQCTQLAV